MPHNFKATYTTRANHVEVDYVDLHVFDLAEYKDEDTFHDSDRCFSCAFDRLWPVPCSQMLVRQVWPFNR